MGGGPSRAEFVFPLRLASKDTKYGAGDSVTRELLEWNEEVNRPKLSANGFPDQVAVGDYFQLLDARQRVEVRRSGSYRLRLHVEQQVGLEESPLPSCKFVVEINGVPAPMYHDLQPSGVSSSSSSSSSSTGTSSTVSPCVGAVYECKRADHAAVAGKYFGVAEVALNRCDTIAVRCVQDGSTKKAQVTPSKLAFGRFVIEALRTSP